MGTRLKIGKVGHGETAVRRLSGSDDAQGHPVLRKGSGDRSTGVRAQSVEAGLAVGMAGRGRNSGSGRAG
jgi:hypothetical protein